MGQRNTPALHGESSTDGSACATVRGGLTDREVALLREMLEIKKALRAGPDTGRHDLEMRLAALKALRRDARRERMARLGYVH